MVDVEQASRELVRALRGARSQTRVSRRMGYRSNVVYRWEAGLRWPSGAELLRLAQITGVEVGRALVRYDSSAATVAAEAGAVGDPAHLTAWLGALRTRTGSINAVARRAGLGRCAAQRVFAGRSEPSVPVLLRLLGALDDRMAEFVALLVDPGTVPSVRSARPLGSPRGLTRHRPWTDAVVCALQTGATLSLAIAQRLDLDVDEVSAILGDLEDAGALSWTAGRPVIDPSPSNEAQVDPGWHRAVTRHWAEHVTTLPDDRVARWCLVASAAVSDLARVMELHREFARQLRRLAPSPDDERVVVIVHQVAALDGKPLGDGGVSPSRRSTA